MLHEKLLAAAVNIILLTGLMLGCFAMMFVIFGLSGCTARKLSSFHFGGPTPGGLDA